MEEKNKSLEEELKSAKRKIKDEEDMYKVKLAEELKNIKKSIKEDVLEEENRRLKQKMRDYHDNHYENTQQIDDDLRKYREENRRLKVPPKYLILNFF